MNAYFQTKWKTNFILKKVFLIIANTFLNVTHLISLFFFLRGEFSNYLVNQNKFCIHAYFFFWAKLWLVSYDSWKIKSKFEIRCQIQWKSNNNICIHFQVSSFGYIQASTFVEGINWFICLRKLLTLPKGPSLYYVRT